MLIDSNLLLSVPLLSSRFLVRMNHGRMGERLWSVVFNCMFVHCSSGISEGLADSDRSTSCEDLSVTVPESLWDF